MDDDRGDIPAHDLTIATALGDRDSAVRDQILGALAGAEDPYRELVRTAIRNPSSAVRAGAVAAVNRIVCPVDLLPLLVEICGDPDGSNRGRAAWALGKLGATAAPALDTLLHQAETDTVPDGRYGAIWAVSRVGPAAAGTEDRVRRFLRENEDEGSRAAAATALGTMTAASAASLTALEEALVSDGMLVREEAAVALGRIASSSGAVAALLGALDDPAPLVREEAAAALGRIGVGSLGTVEALATSLSDPVASVRAKAADSLVLLGAGRPPGERIEDVSPDPTGEQRRTLERWTARLGTEGPFGRAEAAWGLCILGPLARPALEPLRRQALDDPDSDARWAACLAIGRTRHAAPENVTILRGIAGGDEDSDVRSAAVTALGGLGFAAPEVTGTILPALEDEDSLVREEACTALERIGRVPPDGRSALAAAADDVHPSVRMRAAAALATVDRFAASG
jgi:HEAT repeat protein